MAASRYLCSQLVTLSWSDGACTGNLEEICESGAVLECEEGVAAGMQAGIRCGDAFFSGHVSAAIRHEFGWRIEVEFSPMTPWSIEAFRPEHLLDLNEILNPGLKLGGG